MDGWPASAWWWLAGGLLVAEMALGTVQLLILALAAGAAAVVAHLGLSGATQFWVAAVVAAGGTVAWWGRRVRRVKADQAGAAHMAQGLDCGQIVEVAQWQSGDQTRVSYRGSIWSARYQGPSPARSGPHVIVGTEGNTLVLAPSPPSQEP